MRTCPDVACGVIQRRAAAPPDVPGVDRPNDRAPSLHQCSLTARGRNSIKVLLLALLGLIVLVAASTLLRAEESEKRTWRITVEADQPGPWNLRTGDRRGSDLS